jgi:hypothetical protein
MTHRRPIENLESIGKRNPDLKITVSRGRAIEAYNEAKQGLLPIEDTKPLTRAEEVFAQCISKGDSLAAAYKAAYPEAVKEAEWQFDELHKRGYNLSRRANIVRRSLELMKDNKSDRYHTAVRLQRLRRETLEQIASDPTNKNSDRLKALNMLGELPDIQVVEADNAHELTAQDGQEKIVDAIFKILSTESTD